MKVRWTLPRPTVVGPFGLTMAIVFGSPTLDAQSVLALADACAMQDATLEQPCRQAAFAARAAHGLIGMAAAGGPELPGSASTLARRFGGTPRIGVGFGVSGADGTLTTLPGSSGSSSDVGATVWTFRATTVVGLIDGFSLPPMATGILSVDLLGSLALMSLPDDGGFLGSPAAFGLGLRVGVVRESFTLPGLTVSAVRRWVGETRLGELDVELAEVTLDPTVTSVRITTGKALVGLDFFGGVGWDFHDSDVDLTVRPPQPGADVSLRGRLLEDDRSVVYGGIGYRHTIWQLSVHGGYGKAFPAVGVAGSNGSTSGVTFLSLDFRATF